MPGHRPLDRPASGRCEYPALPRRSPERHPAAERICSPKSSGCQLRAAPLSRQVAAPPSARPATQRSCFEVGKDGCPLRRGKPGLRRRAAKNCFPTEPIATGRLALRPRFPRPSHGWTKFDPLAIRNGIRGDEGQPEKSRGDPASREQAWIIRRFLRLHRWK